MLVMKIVFFYIHVLKSKSVFGLYLLWRVYVQIYSALKAAIEWVWTGLREAAKKFLH